MLAGPTCVGIKISEVEPVNFILDSSRRTGEEDQAADWNKEERVVQESSGARLGALRESQFEQRIHQVPDSPARGPVWRS